MVRLLACSFIWALLIRPTVVKSNTPAEIKIMIIECIKSPWQGVFFECVSKIRYWLTRTVFLPSKHCTSTQLKVLSPVCSCRLFNRPRCFKITQTDPVVVPTEIASGNCWPLLSFQASTNEACRREGRKNELSMLRADRAWNIQL